METNTNPIDPNLIVELDKLIELVNNEFGPDEFDNASILDWLDYYYGTMAACLILAI